MTSLKIKRVNLIAIIALVISILIVVIPAVMAYGELTERVDNLDSHIDSLRNIDARIIELEKTAAANEVSLNEIQKDISEIKYDLRSLLLALDSYGGNN